MEPLANLSNTLFLCIFLFMAFKLLKPDGRGCVYAPPLDMPSFADVSTASAFFICSNISWPTPGLPP